MNISTVKVVLTEQDVLSIIQDYAQIEGIEIHSIEIKELITLRGHYKKRITIPFQAKLGLGNIKGNIINVIVFKINVLKIAMLKSIKNIVLKKLLSDFDEYGVKGEKGIITLNLDKMSKLVPYFDFSLSKINIIEGGLEIELEKVAYTENKKLSPIVVKKNHEISTIKTQGEYGKVRNKILEKVPDKYEKIVQYAMFIPDITVLLWRLFRDKRVKIKVKLMLAGVIAYLASPIDIIPDFIPLVGEIDDVAIAFFGLNAIANEVPKEIILENWQGEEDIILLTKEAVNYISKIVGSYNVAKLLEIIKKIFKKGNESYKLVAKKSQSKVHEHNLKVEEEITVNEERDNIH